MSRKSRRLWEGVKTLLILLLTASALWLLYRSPLVQSSGLSTLFEENLSAAPGTSLTPTGLTAAAIPARMVVGSDKGVYGVQYDQAGADALFDLAGPLLGEALSAAHAPTDLSYTQWRSRLGGTCVYFDFTSPVPLSALCSWLKEGGENTHLSHSARLILLSREADGSLSLSFHCEEEDSYIRYETGLDGDIHLTPVVDSITPNGAFFAFEDESLPPVIAAHTLFTGEEPSPAVYNSTTPLLLSDGTLTGQFLSALSFSGQNRAAVTEGVLYVDGEDTLRLYGDGYVEYTGSDGGKYPAGDGLSGAVEAAWALAEQALTPLCGDARLYLMSALPEEDGYTVTFGYMLGGCVVDLYDQGWAARFHVEDGSIREFALYARSYTASGQSKLLLPADKAAAALSALTDTEKELVIHYRDNGGAAVEPGWVGR